MLVKVYIRDENNKLYHLNNWVVTGDEDAVIYDVVALNKEIDRKLHRHRVSESAYKKMINKLVRENHRLKNKLIRFILENDN